MCNLHETGIHVIWRNIRGPFYRLSCGGKHDWEIYSHGAAGCVRCGCEHNCEEKACGELVTLDDGVVACSVTGLIVPSIRCGTEYVTNCQFSETPSSIKQKKQLTDQTQACDMIEEWVSEFLCGEKTKLAHRKEFEKVLNLADLCVVKFVRDFKSRGGGTFCIPDLIAYVLHSIKLRPRGYCGKFLVKRCTCVLRKCTGELRRIRATSNVLSKPFVIGLLYLMRHGLIWENHIWLAPIPELNKILPSECHLKKVFGISPKSICETENEVKSILRQKFGAV